MKKQWLVTAFVLILSASFLHAGKKKADRVSYKGKKWMKVSTEKLHDNPTLFVNKKVYFMIDDARFIGKTHSSRYWYYRAIGKNYLEFRTNTEGGDRLYIWVKKGKKDIVKALSALSEKKDDRIRAFAMVKRKKYRGWEEAGYRYFIIIKYVEKVE